MIKGSYSAVWSSVPPTALGKQPGDVKRRGNEITREQSSERARARERESEGVTERLKSEGERSGTDILPNPLSRVPSNVHP